ncbi:MAG TPA: hypothetical protein GX742_04145, partial [Acholeplasmataceae bacterium]|nr:hypothetical protein [Acholeplasmataceae bacterium]
TQAYVGPTPYLMEEYLVYLDLTGINSEQIKVRFLFATSGGYEFDSVSIDFTDNLPMTIHTMTLESAIMNNEIDVLEKLLLSNDQYVSLDYKDGVRFGFTAPELEEGYSRGFGVATTGYVYAQQAQTSDPLLEQMEGKTFEEIKQIIIDSGRQELIDDIPIVEEFYYTILYIGSHDSETLLELLLSSLNPPGEDD